MKNIIVLLLILLPSIGFCQQFLWSTTKIDDHEGSDVKLIPIASVSEKIFDYYNTYEYYRDLTGFSRTGFERFLNESPNFDKLINWNSSLISTDSAAFAFKGNNGNGSIITVVLVQKENVDVISFTSEYQPGYNHLINKDKFKRWFYSFWPYELAPDESEASLVHYEGVTGLANRGYLIRPKIFENTEAFEGVIVLELTVNKQGKVLNVRPGVKGTTISSPKLYRECERAFLEAQFNPLVDGSERQVGYVTVSFKNR